MPHFLKYLATAIAVQGTFSRQFNIHSVSPDKNQKPTKCVFLSVSFIMYLIIAFTFYVLFCICGEGNLLIFMIGYDKVTSYDKTVPVMVTHHYWQSFDYFMQSLMNN